MGRIDIKTFGLLLLTLLAFAGNSLLTRAALSDPAHGTLGSAMAFAAVRLIAGAVVLAGLTGLTGLTMARHQSLRPGRSDLPTILALFTYAAAFSLAYVSMAAASGALILFAMVQVTMLVLGYLRGHRIGGRAILGVVIALSGLAWLLFPGLTAPPLEAALLMALAGAAWGIYSLLGRGATDPLARTARNFIGTVPLALIAFFLSPMASALTGFGWLMALTSGAVTSALGYALWYAVLPRLPPSLAASAQLSVPVITAFAGALLLAEPMGLRLVMASGLILGGVWLSARG
jgi:drug/metabolite transporter (DMT)-like permease